MRLVAASLWLAKFCSSSHAFRGVSPLPRRAQQSSLFSTIEEPPTKPISSTTTNNNAAALENTDTTYWTIGSTSEHPEPRPLTPQLLEALQTNTHPEETQDELGRGLYVTDDWRKAWLTYESPLEDPDLIDPATGHADYEIDQIEGTIPDDLQGILYRNGAGKFGVGGERVAHVLDADGLVFSIAINGPEGKARFRSRFVHTKGFVEERAADEFKVRGVFGTAPRGLPGLFPPPNKGVNADPSTPPLLSRVAANAFNTDLKNTANTHVISFGGKLLALMEAGRPYALDPETLETIEEDNLGGLLGKEGQMALKFGDDSQMPFDQPEFMGGAYHTAHPKHCPRTGHLVGWHYSLLLPDSDSLELTFTEWSPNGLEKVASTTHVMPDNDLAPHDMALTENCIVMVANALEMNQTPYLLGMQGPAASMTMKGRSNVRAYVYPRPTAERQFEPFSVEVPPCFVIHWSHAYEDEQTGNIVAHFSGWPPSDSSSFLGAWGGYCPDFKVIPPTHIWRLEIDPQTRECVDLSIAPGCINACSEHVLVHPSFQTRPAKYVYAITSNLVGDCSAPVGYTRHCVREGSNRPLHVGEFNSEIDAYWFGSRRFTDEPLVVPKRGADPKDERDAYLLGMVFDAVEQRSFLAVFDLQKDLSLGPVCKLWLKSHIPHGLHGCFAAEGPGTASVFC